jgi:hypothetical protein
MAGRGVPTRSDFPADAEFHIKEFDIPLVQIPRQGWFNWFGGKPRPYDVQGLKPGNNWPAQSFEEWAALVKDSR